MEDVYTIKVKSKPDKRNIYPSERRYSASTVSGLAWVHIALASTSFLLACLALVNPSADLLTSQNETDSLSKNTHSNSELTVLNTTVTLDNTTEILHEENRTDFLRDRQENEENVEDIKLEPQKKGNNNIIVLAPTLLTIFALAAGIASIMASVRWYIDKNIVWLFAISIISTIVSFISFTMVIVWLVSSEQNISDFYKDSEPFKDIIIVKHSDVIERNSSHMVIKNSNSPTDSSKVFTKKVLAINILIACFLELLWSILSVKISYKGMRNNYKEDSNERRGNCVSVVTKIKGNNLKKTQRNAKLIPPKPDLIEHYPNKIKRLYLAQNSNGYYLKTDESKAKNTDTSSEFYKERMNNFLNRCASLEVISNLDHDDTLNVIPEASKETIPESTPEVKDRMTPQSWGDTPDHTIYNQNTLNLENIFKFSKSDDVKTENDKELE